MNSLNRRTAIRIAAVSLLLAAIASPISWFLARQITERSIVWLAVEESQRAWHYFDSLTLDNEQAKASAEIVAAKLVGGIFDIAEIYDAKGAKLTEKMTPDGDSVESLLPKHGRPLSPKPSYESLELPSKQWVLRVFVPLQSIDGGVVTGYFEGVRIVSEWQHEQIMSNALAAAVLAALASLLCGAAIYPVVTSLTAENERKTREVLDSHISMMEALGRAIAKRDSDTGAHNYRVAWIAARIGEQIGLPNNAMQSLIAGSFLHDVGKIGIPDAILLKPGKLDEEEFSIMRTHVAKGEEIVTGMGWLDGANDVVAGHHEKWNGSGYPRRLQGEAIPFAARIFAVADVFDALCSKRPYKQPMGFDEVMAILERDTGTHFDPGVMLVFRAMAQDIYATLSGCDEEGTRQLLQQRIQMHFAV